MKSPLSVLEELKLETEKGQMEEAMLVERLIQLQKTAKRLKKEQKLRSNAERMAKGIETLETLVDDLTNNNARLSEDLQSAQEELLTARVETQKLERQMSGQLATLERLEDRLADLLNWRRIVQSASSSNQFSNGVDSEEEEAAFQRYLDQDPEVSKELLAIVDANVPKPREAVQVPLFQVNRSHMLRMSKLEQKKMELVMRDGLLQTLPPLRKAKVLTHTPTSGGGSPSSLPDISSGRFSFNHKSPESSSPGARSWAGVP